MGRNIILTEDDLTEDGMISFRMNGKVSLSSFSTSPKDEAESERIIFVNNGTGTILKDRHGPITKQGDKVMSIEKEQSTALTKAQSYDVMEMSDNQYARLKDMAEAMSNSVVTVPKHLHGKPADCMAIILQAKSWGMDPMPVAQKTHLINGTLGYEAQLVNAVLCSSGAIVGRPKFRFEGDWSKIEGKQQWRPSDEEGLACTVTCRLPDGAEESWTTYLTSCTVRNSPNWNNGKVKLQLSYQTIKEWARVHTPDAILGVYTRDELPMADMIEVEATEIPSKPKGESKTAAIAEALTGKKQKKEPKPKKEEKEPEQEQEPQEDAVTEVIEPEAQNDGPEPGPPKKVTKTALSKACAKTGVPDQLLKEYCISCNAIKEDQTLDDLPENWKRRICESPEGVKKAVNNWADEEN